MEETSQKPVSALTDRKEIAKIKRWAIQFSAMEWNKLCSNREFLTAFFEDNSTVERLASEMTGREVSKIE